MFLNVTEPIIHMYFLLFDEQMKRLLELNWAVVESLVISYDNIIKYYVL